MCQTSLVLPNKLICHARLAEEIDMPCSFLIFNQSDYMYLIQIVDIKYHTDWQTVQIQISWLRQNPHDLDLYCLQKQGLCLAGQGLKSVSKCSCSWVIELIQPVSSVQHVFFFFQQKFSQTLEQLFPTWEVKALVLNDWSTSSGTQTVSPLIKRPGTRW